jgi:hypothetical protein
MSLAIALSKAGRAGPISGRGPQGDPGFFSFIGKALGAVSTVLPGPLGVIGKTVGGALAGKPISTAKQTAMLPALPGTAPFAPTGSGVSVGPGGIQIGTWGKPPALAPAPGGAITGPVVGTPSTVPCTSGYHHNKTTYYTKKYGVIYKGTVCVRNRRRNPLNPRALSRAMSRVASAQKAVRCLGLFAGAPARASAKRIGRKSRCRKCR